MQIVWSAARHFTETLLPMVRLCAFHNSGLKTVPGGLPLTASFQSMQWKNKAEFTTAREGLIVKHLPIVRIIAQRVHRKLPAQVNGDDLYSAGVLGLMEAVDRFDPSKQVLFRTYAQGRIRGAILDSLRLLDWGPRGLRRKGRDIERAIHMLTGQLKRAPDELEIAQKLNMELADYQRLLGNLKDLEMGTLRTERSTGSQEEMVYIPGRPEDEPLFRCLNAEMRRVLGVAIRGLPERECRVIKLRYYDELTMREIAALLGVTDARVSQIHASAVLHLRAAMIHHFHRVTVETANPL